MNLNKRIGLRAASWIMLGGWLYSILMSSMPLFGVSNYSSTRYLCFVELFTILRQLIRYYIFSICLPMEASDLLDIIYLFMIIGISGFAFCFIAVCYAQIYLSLGKETRQAARSASRGEMTVAKKMALLVSKHDVRNCWDLKLIIVLCLGVYKLCMLGADRIFWNDRPCWSAVH